MEEKKCLNCSTVFTGNYCNNCGEKVYKQHDKTIVHLLEEMLHFITHFEGTFFRTLKTMFSRPGQLSQDYCDGVRKKYFKPVSLYFLLVVVYLVFPFMPGLNMPLKNYRNQGGSSSFTERIIESKQQKGLDYAAVEKLYEAKSGKVSKFMLLLVLPLCAVVLMMLFYRRKFLFFDHFILAAEINSIFLLVMFILLPLLLAPLTLLLHYLKSNFFVSDNDLITMAVAILCTYSIASFRRFYGAGWAEAVFKSLLFSVGQLFILFYVYKILLFVTVMAMI